MAEVMFLALRYSLDGVSKPHLSTHINIQSSNEYAKQYVTSQHLQLQHAGYRLEKLQFRPETRNTWPRSFIKE
jgi:hypothetical protein